MGGTVEPTTAFSDQTGQFFDLQHPVSCRGNITKWHYCYYTSALGQPDTTHIVYLRVWRPMNSNSWTRVYEVRLNVVPDIGSPVVCQETTLREDQRFVVERDDILAVYLPVLSDGLPVVAQGVPLSQLYLDIRGSFEPFSAQTVRANDLTEMASLALNLYADVGECL